MQKNLIFRIYWKNLKKQIQNILRRSHNILVYSSSSENEIEEESEMGNVLNQMNSELQGENISVFASDLLQDDESDTDLTSELLIDGEAQAFLDGKQTTNSPKRKKHRMQG